MRALQVIRAWRYPCEGVLPFMWSENQDMLLEVKYAPVKTKGKLVRLEGGCICGRGCKPQRIKITVEAT